MGDTHVSAFADFGPDRHTGSAARAERCGGSSGAKGSLSGFLSRGVRGSQLLLDFSRGATSMATTQYVTTCS